MADDDTAYVSVWVQGENIILIEWGEGQCALRGAILHDRLSTMDLFPDWMAGRDPEGEDQVLRELGKQDQVPWQSLKPTFFIPEGALTELARLLVIGSNTCVEYDDDGPGDVLEDMLNGSILVYSYVSTPEPCPETVMVVLFMNRSNEAMSALVKNRASGLRLLRELNTSYGPDTRARLREELENLPTCNQDPPYYFGEVTTEVLMVGFLTRQRHTEQEAASAPQLD
jgi:hypothetical protein